MKKEMILKIFILQLVIGATVWLSPACAQVAKKPAQNPNLESQILALLADVRLAQPELAADMLLKIAKSKKIKDENWRVDLLEEALRTADNVQYGIRRRSIPIGGLPVDTQPGYFDYAFDLKLDKLSLKARVIEQFLEIQPARARQLLLELSSGLSLKPLQCEDSMAYEASDIYRVVGVAAAGGERDGRDERERSHGLDYARRPARLPAAGPSECGPARDGALG